MADRCILCGGGLGAAWVSIGAVGERVVPGEPLPKPIVGREWHVHRECLLNPPVLAKSK